MDLGINFGFLSLLGIVLYLNTRAYKRTSELEKKVLDTQIRFNDRIAELENKVFLLSQSPSDAPSE